MTELRFSGMSVEARHRHGTHVHDHPHRGAHRHLTRWQPSQAVWDFDAHEHVHPHNHEHPHDPAREHGEHGHSHGLVDRSILRSREGLRAVAISLVVLGATAIAQLMIFLLTGSVALLADLIHNFGDALTAVPLAIAFYLRSFRAEDAPPVQQTASFA